MIFVTGTDTACGKTTVGRAICAALRRRGMAVAAFKPIETGCEEREGGRRVAADAEALARAAGCELPPELLCPVRLLTPASPERAAAAEGCEIDLEAIDAAWLEVRRRARFVVAEGAGGLLVPITATATMADLPARLGLPVLIVARDALGTVNHTLLTIEALRARGLALAGVVFSSPAAPGAEPLDNAAAVAAHGGDGVRVLGAIPHLPGADDATLAAAAEAHLDLDAICRLAR
jgi:dethiobiotin synthetase